MTFKQFMEQYHGQDNPFGDLAADMKRDAAFPDADVCYSVFSGSAAGKVTVNLLPWGSTLSTAMVPP